MSVKFNQMQERIRSSSLGGNKAARYLFLSQIVGKKVQTESGVTIGRLKDLAFKDDPRYAEVTSLVV
jgi:hypothetical protein